MILTEKQIKFLNYIDDLSIGKTIYRTGGTALARRYNHRLSTDLDFFSFDFLPDFELLPTIANIKSEFMIQTITKQSLYNRNIFLCSEDFDNLKFEMTFFPFPTLQGGDIRKRNLRIDSIFDIAVNKIHAISERQEVKDLYDMYYILTKENYSISDLIQGVEKKFGVSLQEKDIIARLLYLTTFLDSIKPFLINEDDTRKVKSFFEEMI